MEYFQWGKKLFMIRSIGINFFNDLYQAGAGILLIYINFARVFSADGFYMCHILMCTGLRINLIVFIYYIHMLKQDQMFMILNHSIYFFRDDGYHRKDFNLVRIIKE